MCFWSFSFFSECWQSSLFWINTIFVWINEQTYFWLILKALFGIHPSLTLTVLPPVSKAWEPVHRLFTQNIIFDDLIGWSCLAVRNPPLPQFVDWVLCQVCIRHYKGVCIKTTTSMKCEWHLHTWLALATSKASKQQQQPEELGLSDSWLTNKLPHLHLKGPQFFIFTIGR